MGTFNVGIRLHDLPEGTVEERFRMAAGQGFKCLQLPSKVLYASYGIDRGGLARELADHLRGLLDELGLSVAVLGCYQNLATPDAAALEDALAEYQACLQFASWLGGCPVGTETGRPNAENAVDEDRFSKEALQRFCAHLECFGAGTTGAYDMAQIAYWAAGSRLGIDCVVENSTPDTAAQSLAYLQQW